MAERKKKEGPSQGGAPAWVVTYGDMMSLLLTFFVLLLSFSVISEQEFTQAIVSLRGALGVLDKNTGMLDFMPQPKRSRREAVEEMRRLARELRRRMQVLGAEKEIKVELDLEQGGISINLPSRVLFDTASADLRPEAHEILNDVAGVLRDIPEAFIEVRGHTDSRPLRSTSLRFADNWDLSYHRAKSVMFFLRDVAGMATSQFEAIACGPSQPVATNATEEGMQANRRVQLFVRGSFTEDLKRQIEERVEQMTQSVSDLNASEDLLLTRMTSS